MTEAAQMNLYIPGVEKCEDEHQRYFIYVVDFFNAFLCLNQMIKTPNELYNDL